MALLYLVSSSKLISPSNTKGATEITCSSAASYSCNKTIISYYIECVTWSPIQVKLTNTPSTEWSTFVIQTRHQNEKIYDMKVKHIRANSRNPIHHKFEAEQYTILRGTH